MVDQNLKMNNVLEMFKAPTNITALDGVRVSVPKVCSIQEIKRLMQWVRRDWLHTAAVTSGSAYLATQVQNCSHVIGRVFSIGNINLL